ncbi:IS481 family transposase, partial [Klebsiella quasipneumoniae]|nr:IS481 family transposase [Klebsiella quasipneumoniae]
YLVLYNSKRPHKSLELMTPVDYILRESKNCNMWWTHTRLGVLSDFHRRARASLLARLPGADRRAGGV